MDERRPLIEEIQVSSSIKDIAVDEGELIVNRTTVIEEKLNFPNPKTIHDVFEHGKIKPAKALVYLKPVSNYFRFFIKYSATEYYIRIENSTMIVVVVLSYNYINLFIILVLQGKSQLRSAFILQSLT